MPEMPKQNGQGETESDTKSSKEKAKEGAGMIRLPDKRNKYHAQKYTVYGITFDSKREGEQYLIYRGMLNRKEIVKLECQPTFELLPTFKSFGKTQRGIKYTPDFLLTYPNGRVVAVEVKGVRTQDYILRAKLFRWLYKDIELVEVR